MENVLLNFIAKYVFLSEDEKNALVSLDMFRAFKKGTILLKEGQLSRDGYFVLKGCLRTFYVVDGNEKTTAFYTEMEGITPHCVLSEQPSEYFIACVEDSILTVANPDMEVAMYEKFPKFESLCRVLSEELLAKAQYSLDQFKTLSPEERYANLVETRPDLLQRIPQHQLASFIGITPQSLSRLRARIVTKKQQV